ncbi:MAG: prolyl-tRNA synthetase [Hyperionvirus sp.]|uniref:proline--tRNA ligase n=1 Tax=Hyperionvirus sp. TaxID=2487770 RepID=A0A3G5AF85_9VIRU|nr:MAG: prolyl-tRNA synthetase [Hyperionvirus sp.]
MTTHLTGITTKKNENFSEWYLELVYKTKMIVNYDVSGCYALLPNSYSIWEQIQKYLDIRFKSLKVENVYFPLLITEKNLSKEVSHLEGFTPEVAWVTKVGKTDLAEKLAVRPTSECVIYPLLPGLIRSHNDLPLKYNQWCSVVRWEFKDPTPFIRSREFLWQEGHTAHKNMEDAMSEIHEIISIYKDAYRLLLCVPVICGKKTSKETFAGAFETHTIETFIPSAGKAIQAATAHCLADNFSKIFDIKFTDKDQKICFAIQNSWGFTTRSIGIMLMTHGDDKGAIFPPLVAPKQIVIIPIYTTTNESTVISYCEKLYDLLLPTYRVELDLRKWKPGAKYNHWELLGVPIRLEIGIKEIKTASAILYRRDTTEKENVPLTNIIPTIASKMIAIADNLYATAYKKIYSSITDPQNLEALSDAFNNKQLCLINWCQTPACTDYLDHHFKAKSLCIPNDKAFPSISQNPLCVICNTTGKTSCLYGKSY